MRRNLFPLFYAVSLIAISCSNLNSEINNNPAPINQQIMVNDDFFTNSHWNDPHVIHDGSDFIMYASSDSYESAWDGYVRIFRFTSANGKDWIISNGGNPVLSLGSDQEWDSHSTETPAVVYFNGEYHMFYTGYDVAYDYTEYGDDNIWGTTDDDTASKHFRIGHATSPDGINWTKDPSNPLVSPTDPYGDINLDFNQSVVGEPAPVVFNNQIYLYFTALGAATEVGTTWQTIGLIKSNSEGTSWSTPQRVLTPDVALYPRNSGEEYIGYSTPNAILRDDKVNLYFDVVENSPWTQTKIHHAYSEDGETSWIQDSSPLLEREDFNWTREEIRSPSALMYEDKLYLYFAGHYFDGGNPYLSIGLMVY